MDWNGLRIVLAVGRHGTLTGAGEDLGMAHTTVSRKLTKLERELGARLFDRTPDGWRATPAGLRILAAAQAMEAELHGAELAVRGENTELEGPLRVSTLDFLFETYIDVFRSFCERYPNIELIVDADLSQVSLYRRQADVVFRMSNEPPETLVGRKVGRMDFAVYGHRSLASTDDWSALPWLHWDPALDNIAKWMDGFLADSAPGARIAIRLGENTLLRRASLRAGLGLHPLPVPEGEADPDLVRFGPVLSEFSRDLWVLTAPALRNTGRVKAFIDHLARGVAAASKA